MIQPGATASLPARGTSQLCGFDLLFNLVGTQFHHLENGPMTGSISKDGHTCNKVRAVREVTELTQVYGHGGLEHLGHWPQGPGGAVRDRMVGGAEPLARLREMAASRGGDRPVVWRGIRGVGGQIFRDAAVTGCRRPERRAGH